MGVIPGRAFGRWRGAAAVDQRLHAASPAIGSGKSPGRPLAHDVRRARSSSERPIWENARIEPLLKEAYHAGQAVALTNADGS